jgi:hypothetical protein
MGIATDRAPSVGIGLLELLGPFDEISAGRSWLNIGALKYVWSEHPGEASVPQVVVLQRTVEYGRVVRLTDERVMLRKAGVPDIVAWSVVAFPGAD